MKACEGGYDDVDQYQLLVRVIREQTIREEDGRLRLKTKEDGGMGSGILQNPADPKAAYREKAGKQNRGYAANVTEEVGENGSIVKAYQFEQNTHSDSEFLDEQLNQEEKTPERRTLVTDGAYSSEELRKKQTLRTSISYFFGFKIAALNFRKLCSYLDSMEKCAQIVGIA